MVTTRSQVTRHFKLLDYSPRSYKVIAVCIVLLISACAHKGPNYATGIIAGESISENLDSEIAKHALTSNNDQYDDQKINQLLDQLEITETPDSHQLQSLATLGSTDFASIIYARALLKEGSNTYWQSRSLELSQRVNHPQFKSQISEKFSKHHALLIPGWNWETRHDTGADLEFQQNVLARYGLTSSLVRTDEHGNVETNAQIVTNAIHEARHLNKSIILISVSKGGADTAYALGKLVNMSDIPYLAGWLNIGGIISGSTLVELEVNNPEKWLTSIGFAPDTPLNAVRSLKKDVAFERASELSYPNNITIVNYVALPFASNLSKQSVYSYTRLAQYGPNDGAALTHEMLVPEQHTVLEIGLDHFMRSFKAMNRAIALLYMITESKQ